MPIRTEEIIAGQVGLEGQEGQEGLEGRPSRLSRRSRPSRLFGPPGVIELELPQHVAPRAGIDVGRARYLVNGRHSVLNVGGSAAKVLEVWSAARWHSAQHGAWIPQRKPRSIESADNAALVALRDERF